MRSRHRSCLENRSDHSLRRNRFGLVLRQCGIVALFPVTLLWSATQPKANQASPAQPEAAQSDKGPHSAIPAGRVDQVVVTGGIRSVDVEITTSQPVVMRSQLVTGPDRLILDFPNALPGTNLHDQNINRGQVKGIRVGMFAQDPPTTRVVIDLKSALPYRIYPSGKTVSVQLAMDEREAAAAPQGHINDVSFTPPAAVKPVPVLQVEYKNGRLSILAHDVSLAQVLHDVQRKTGADIPIPSVASQEQIVANISLLPIREALTALLNGSRFNFVMVGEDNDPSKLKSLVLTFRSGAGISQPAIVSTPQPVVDSQPEANVPQPEPVQPQPDVAPPPDQPQPDAQPQPDPQPQQPQEGAGQQEAPQPQDAPPPQ